MICSYSIILKNKNVLFLYYNFTRVQLSCSPFSSSFLSYLPSLKMEIEKLANEKTEMQRHYVMVSSFPSSPSPCQTNSVCLAHNKHLHLSNALSYFVVFLQYYEMSYGLNVEMHKQVSMLDL